MNWRKVLSAVVGALAGALTCAFVVLLAWDYMLGGRHNDRDYLGFLAMLGIAFVAALMGAAAWGFGASRLLARDSSGVIVMAGAIAMSAALAFSFLFWREGIPWVERWKRQRAEAIARGPAVGDDRARWLNAVQPQPQAGLTLAQELLACAGEHQFPRDPEALIASGCHALEASCAERPHGTWYKPGDKAWRWRIEGSRIVVAIDDVVQQAKNLDAPVFEVWGSGLLVQRAKSSAGPVLVRSSLVLAERFRSCLVHAAPALKGSGNWSGDWTELVDDVSSAGGCEGLIVEADDRDELGSQQVRVFQRYKHQGPPTRIRYRGISTPEGGFEFVIRESRRKYFLDRHGSWHAAAGRRDAAETDPPPQQCEFDLAVACTT